MGKEVLWGAIWGFGGLFWPSWFRPNLGKGTNWKLSHGTFSIFSFLLKRLIRMGQPWVPFKGKPGARNPGPGPGPWPDPF